MRDAAAQRADPAKPTRKKKYFVNILFYGSVWGVCICASPSQPAKAVLRELQTRFAGRRDAGSARVALSLGMTEAPQDNIQRSINQLSLGMPPSGIPAFF